MAKPLDPRVKEILAKYHPDPRSALWDCHGTWVVYHKDVELMAAKAGIQFDPPTVLEANGPAKCVALCVWARLDHGETFRADWSIGEAAPCNNKNAYPYAMAEKRARDRVALKLLGLAGFVYSEEESDDFKDNRASREPAAPSAAEAYVKQSLDIIAACQSSQQLRDWWKNDSDMRGHLFAGKDDPDFQPMWKAFIARGDELTKSEKEAA